MTVYNVTPGVGTFLARGGKSAQHLLGIVAANPQIAEAAKDARNLLVIDVAIKDNIATIDAGKATGHEEPAPVSKFFMATNLRGGQHKFFYQGSVMMLPSEY